jgi:hypothetical protein
MMARRTQINDFDHIEKPEDLEHIVKDKRSGKRASKSKGKRRNRHYNKTLLRHLTKNVD